MAYGGQQQAVAPGPNQTNYEYAPQGAAQAGNLGAQAAYQYQQASGQPANGFSRGDLPDGLWQTIQGTMLQEYAGCAGA